MYKYFLGSLVFAALCMSAYSQQNDNIAFAGHHAVFIFHGFPPASPKFPDAAGNTGFTLQRREGTASTWVTIRTFHSPQGIDEVIANYNEAISILPDAKRMVFSPVEAWQKWEKYKTFDSLRTEVSYAPAQIAFAILVADTTVQAGKTYQYRIVKNVIAASVDSNFISNTVAYPARLDIPVPKFLKRQSEKDAIILSWFSKGYKAVENFNVYRATGSDRIFTQIRPGVRVIQSRDSVIYSLIDRNVAFSEMYQYYIEPVNGFSGGGNIISDTIPATCMNPQQLQTPQDIYTKPDLAHQAIVINYTLPNRDFIGSIHVFRSQHFDTGFIEVGITGAGETSYTDMRVRPGIKYYYYLLMTDKMGRNSPRSIKTFGLYQDTANDQPPRNASVEKRRDGMKVTWLNPPIKEDISGYYVYRSIGGGSSFQRITTLLPVKDSLNSYLDTTKLLTSGTLYSYCVQSENLSNKLSNNSNIAFVKTNEDTSALQIFTPRNLKALIDSTNAMLIWFDMRAVNNNLASYRISRKTTDAKEFKVINEDLPAVYSSWLDTSIQPGQSYQYAIESIDVAGHHSAQATSNIIKLVADVLPAPVISLFKTKDGISLSWDDATDPRIHSYNVYRYTKGDKPAKVGHVNLGKSSYTDTGLTPGKMYYYYVEADAENRNLKILQSNRVYIMIGSNDNKNN